MNVEAEFKDRVVRWASCLKVSPVQIRLQPMRRKWASCSASGRLSFCRDLLQHSTDFQDYVIVHELLHMRIPNHGKLFNAMLKMYLRGNSWSGTSWVHGYTANAEGGVSAPADLGKNASQLGERLIFSQ